MSTNPTMRQQILSKFDSLNRPLLDHYQQAGIQVVIVGFDPESNAMSIGGNAPSSRAVAVLSAARQHVFEKSKDLSEYVLKAPSVGELRAWLAQLAQAAANTLLLPKNVRAAVVLSDETGLWIGTGSNCDTADRDYLIACAAAGHDRIDHVRGASEAG